MTRKTAERLLKDLRENITDVDYIDTIYLSTRKSGTKIFRNCSYIEEEGYTFIWTKTENFLISRKDVGDYVVVPLNLITQIKIKKVA